MLQSRIIIFIVAFYVVAKSVSLAFPYNAREREKVIASNNTKIKTDDEASSSPQIPGGFDRKVYLHPASECILYLHGTMGIACRDALCPPNSLCLIQSLARKR